MGALKTMTGWLIRFNSAILAVCRVLIIGLVAVIALVLIAAVVFRYGLNNALTWAEELTKYLMVWLTFLGAPIALRNFGHINIDLVVKALPARWEQVMHLLVSLIIIVTMSVILWTGFNFAEQGARQVASTFNLSMVYLYISVPLGAALTLLVAVEQALLAAAGVIDPAAGLIIPNHEIDSAI